MKNPATYLHVEIYTTVIKKKKKNAEKDTNTHHQYCTQTDGTQRL